MDYKALSTSFVWSRRALFSDVDVLVHWHLNTMQGLLLTSADFMHALKGREDDNQRRVKEAERSSLRAEHTASRSEDLQESREKRAEGQRVKERSRASDKNRE